jgi:ribosomal protein S1
MEQTTTTTSTGGHTAHVMDSILAESKNPPVAGDIVEGRVVALHKSSVIVDIHPFGSGIIYGREYNNARDIIKNISIGDEVSGTVIETNNEDGY